MNSSGALNKMLTCSIAFAIEGKNNHNDTYDSDFFLFYRFIFKYH